jgi:hypothetical protein
MPSPRESPQAAHADLRLVLVYVMPIGLANLGWKMYIINGSWNVVTFVLIVSHLLIVLTDLEGAVLGRNKGAVSGGD